MGSQCFKKIYVCCIGDSTDVKTRGGSPYFCCQALRGYGIKAEPLPLSIEKLVPWRRLWVLKQLTLLKHPKGFQYGRTFTWLVERQWPKVDQGDWVLSWHPFVLPDAVIESGQFCLYLDCTQAQVFEHYSKSVRSRSLIASALAREKAILIKAPAIFCMSQWVADSLVDEYKLDSSRIFVVPAGSNICESQLKKLIPVPVPLEPTPQEPLRLGFLGKEWQRKGGPFLLELADALQQRGIPTVIRAIGPDPAALPAHPALQPLGFINKQTDTARFVAELKTWHFGTLFSEAEAFGISNRECLRLGVPVLAHAVGGIASTLPDAGCGQLFAPHPGAAEVAEWIEERLTPYDGYLSWRMALSARWQEFTWEVAVEQMIEIFNE